MILLIDNYDSFVYNLARYIGKLGREKEVVRNDEITLDEIALNPPEAIILSPGPKEPKDAGICNALIQNFYNRIPILGICLGHQCIGEMFGGRTIRAPQPVHGKQSTIQHNADNLFMGLPNPMKAGRYHSLITELAANSELEIIARTVEDDIIMGIKHRTAPLYGLQFHPESILTPYGLDIMRNFLLMASEWNDVRFKGTGTGS